MREKLSNKEQLHGHEHGNESTHHLQEILKDKVERARHDAEKHHGTLEKARAEAERQATPAMEIEDESVKTPDELHTFAGHQLLKSDAYRQVLAQTRQRLSTGSQLFSRLVHQKNIETLSEIGSKTAARPSGLLGGGIGAFLGSCILLYVSKTYGFEYNFSLFIILFCGGFLAGLGLEVVFRLFKKR